MARRTLPNGLRVIVLQLPHLHGVSHAMLVRAGPRFENEQTNGLSHVVEHLLFRGTVDHPSSFAFNASVEALGGEINGLTQRDATTIHVTVPPSTASEGLTLLGDLCTQPLLTGLDVERAVVMEEILDTLDGSGHELDPDAISRQVLWQGHPIGMPVAGSVENVERFTEDDCRAHYRRTFVGANGVLCIAGPVDIGAMFDTAERAFCGLERGAMLGEGLTPVPAWHPAIHVQETDGSQVCALLSFPAPHENHPDFAKLLLLRRVLDDGLASRLRQDVCEARGLAYSVCASMDVYADVGAIDVEATCSRRKVLRTVGQMITTLSDIVAGGVSEAELDRVKVRHRAELEFALDDPAEMCGWYGSSELVGCSATYEDRLHEAMAVTPQDIARLAERIFARDRALLTMVGPVDPAHVTVLEDILGRAPCSAVWLDADEDEGEGEAEADASVEADEADDIPAPLVAVL